MGVEHVFVVYDQKPTVYDLGFRKKVSKIELVHFEFFTDENNIDNAIATQRSTEAAAAAAAAQALRDAQAAARDAEARAQANINALQEAANAAAMQRQRDYGADAEDHDNVPVFDYDADGGGGGDSGAGTGGSGTGGTTPVFTASMSTLSLNTNYANRGSAFQLTYTVPSGASETLTLIDKFGGSTLDNSSSQHYSITSNTTDTTSVPGARRVTQNCQLRSFTTTSSFTNVYGARDFTFTFRLTVGTEVRNEDLYVEGDL